MLTIIDAKNKAMPEVKVLVNGVVIGYASMYDLADNGIGGCERVLDLPAALYKKVERRLLMMKARYE